MIFYLVRQQHAYTVIKYLESWGIKTTASFVRPLFYEKLWQMKKLPTGTYIFSDLERLEPEEAELTAQVWEQLNQAGQNIRLLNHPTRSMRRYELLRTLYERGWNQFNVYRLTECRQSERFPVFLRGENDHQGSHTPLLNTADELSTALAKISQEGKSRENKLIIGFCDTKDEKGIYRKYSAFIIGDNIIPRHICFSKEWMIKHPELVEPEMIQEEQEYIKNNPHESYLKKVFEVAGIEYGRIDYSLLNGVPQVWEINTNPMSLFEITNNNKIQQLRLPLSEYIAKRFEVAFATINCSTSSSISIPITIQSKKNDKPYLIKALKGTIFWFFQLAPYPIQLATHKKVKKWLLKLRTFVKITS
jgi:hypothetical protein